MAKSLLYDKSVENSIFVNGILDKKAKNIVYSENDEIKQASIQSLLKGFASKKIDFIVFVEHEREWLLNIDQYKEAKIIGTLDIEENILLGVLDDSVKILKQTK